MRSSVPMAQSGSSVELQDMTRQLYAELKGLAATLRRQHQVGDTLNTTALVGEAYLKLRHSGGWESRQHFLRVAAHAIRQVLVDEARYWLTAKRQGASSAVSLEDQHDVGEAASDEFLVNLDQALTQLEAFNPRLAALVECRYFAGYSDDDITALLDITERTLRRDWVKAKAWLHHVLGEEIH